MTGKELTKAVIYTRVASGTDAERTAAHAEQEQHCRHHAQEKGYSVVETFRDEISGNALERPGMASMLAYLAAKRGENCCVLLDDPHRLARNVSALLVLRDRIRDAGGSLEIAASGRTLNACFPGRMNIENDKERGRDDRGR